MRAGRSTPTVLANYRILVPTIVMSAADAKTQTKSRPVAFFIAKRYRFQ